MNVWHLRLGHSVLKLSIRRLIQSQALPHVVCRHIDCEERAKGKFRRRLSGSISSASTVGTLYVDTKGALETDSVQGHKYFVTIIEEVSRFVAVRPIKSKSDAAPAVFRFVRFFEKQSGCTVKKIHADGGTEFRRALSELEDEGVEISITTAYTPESNGLVERTHQTVSSNARTCLKQAQLPSKYRSYAIRHVVDAWNSIPNKKTGKTPHTVLFGHPPSYLRHLRPFGCRMLYRPPMKKIPTFEPRAKEGICLYHEGGGIYNILDGDHVVRLKHSEAKELSFPGLQLFSSDSYRTSNSEDSNSKEDDIDVNPSDVIPVDTPSHPPAVNK